MPLIHFGGAGVIETQCFCTIIPSNRNEMLLYSEVKMLRYSEI